MGLGGYIVPQTYRLGLRPLFTYINRHFTIPKYQDDK